MELELVLGIPAHVWLELEANYQAARKRLEHQNRMQEDIDALKLFPVRKMIELGWIKKAETREKQAYALLSYFGVASLSQLNTRSVLEPAFRKSETKEACPYALATWLRRGEIQAREITLLAFDPRGLRARLGELRGMSLLQPEAFGPQLVKTCAACGVAVVFVPHLPRSYVGGTAYWIGDKAVIQLSLRFGTNDHFWFSFFHELGHILLHGKKETFLDDFKENSDQKESEANGFARKALIPDAGFERLKKLSYGKRDVVKTFSEEIGIAPGIVVGRLQHEGLVPYQSFMNNLKVKLAWHKEVSPGD